MLRGDAVVFGVAREDTRGTFKTPEFWIPTRSPAGLQPQLEKELIEETRHTAIQSRGSEAVQKRGEGDVEFNIRNKTFPILTENLLGEMTTTAQGDGTFEHIIEVKLDGPQNPTLSGAISQPSQQDYGFPGLQLTNMEITVQTDDLVHATIDAQSRDVSEQSDFTVSFANDDYHFRHQDVKLEIADSVNGSFTEIPTISTSLTVSNNGEPRQDIGNLNPKDIVAGLFDINGNFDTDQVDSTFRDHYFNQENKALRLTMTRSDVTIGTGTENPTIEITLPNITFEDYEPDRSRDEVVTNSMDFTAHYDDSEAKAIKMRIINEEDYS